MTAGEFEDAVWNVEHVRIVVRCPRNTQLPDYNFQNAANQADTLNTLLGGRLRPVYENFEIQIVSGRGVSPRLNTSLRTVRESYQA